MTGVFLKAREGYVWAESKAKEWKPGPIVKQPTFLKGVDPYKGFREQTKEQVVGAAQIGKVTMGATAGIVEDIKVKPYKLPLIYAAGVVAGPVATKVIGTGKFAKVAGIGFGTAFAAGVGVQTAVTPAGLEREKLIGVRAAELTAFLSGAKYGIEKKPLAELYKARVRGPRFERQIDKWQKGITAKDWTYLEKRAFIPIKKMPQRTLYGEPIKPTEIRIAKKAAGLDPGFYGMDIARYRVTGYDTKFSQKLVTDVYKLKTIGYTKPKLFKLPKPIKKVTAIITKPIKVIDWRQQKVIDLSPKKMDSITRQMLTAEPMRFTVIDKPPIKLPLYQRVEALRLKEIPKWPEFQKQLFWVKSKVTKIDRPFYIGKPKLPKPVKLGIPKSTAPVHVKPIPKPVKIKPTEAMPGVSVRPVYAAPPKPTAPADVGEVFGTIPGGRALAGTLILSGIKHKDWTSALSRQFGESRRKQQQKQNAKLAILLDQPTKQEEEQTPKQAPKLSQYLKQIPKQIPEQIPKQIPKQTPRVVTIPKIIQIPEIIPIPPYIPPPYIPQPKKPEPPLPLIPLPFIFPKIKYGVPKKKKKKKKKFKPTYKYTPSLFAVSKKITTKQIPMPKYLTGVGIRPIKLKF